MKKVIVLLLLILPFTLQAKYKFDETLFIPIEQTGVWKKGKQTSSEDGASLTRFMLESETQKNWSKLITIQFKDRHLIQGSSAEEAMMNEQRLSPLGTWALIKNQPNDVIYERAFPAGEHELVRMIMTQKGLHRVAYLKQGPFDVSERSQWVGRLMNSVVGS